MSLTRRVYDRVLRGGRVDGRSRRYLRTGVIGIVLIWILSIAYLLLVPKSYTSEFTFILPGTGAGSSVNLENLGQASSTSAPAFSPDLSPTENYRKMLMSHRVLAAAAETAGLPPSAFPTPKIELAEQTKLIIISIKAGRPDLALARAEALRSAFLSTLDGLRGDEFTVRDAASRDMLNADRGALEQARQRLILHQVKTGLVSLEQYNGIVTAVEHLREQLRDTEVKLAQTKSGVEELTRLLGTTADAANLAMLLRSDPFFQADLDLLAKNEGAISELSGTHAEANQRIQDLRAAQASIAARLKARGEELAGRKLANIARSSDLSLHDERARLFERLVGQLADQEALEGMRAELASQIESEQRRVTALAQDASQLDDLKRDVQVAEAVFSSALARVGTSRSDFFASYPLVQTLEAPDLPKSASSPSKIVALGGALAASFFLSLALVMIWLRTHLLSKLLKSESSLPPSSEAGPGISWVRSI